MLLSYSIYLTHAMDNKVLILQTLFLKIIDYYYTVVIINIFHLITFATNCSWKVIFFPNDSHDLVSMAELL